MQRIEEDEIHHRAGIGSMLAELGAGPDLRLDRKLRRIGRMIGILCRVGGWFIPMYGAGRLERPNIAEYEDAARCAWLAGYTQYVDRLLGWAEVEWDHERYFREKAASHFLRYVFPLWLPPPPRETIRISFEQFCLENTGPTALPSKTR